MSLKHQTWHLDWFIASHIERQEFVCPFLLYAAGVDADDFPAAEAAARWVVMLSDHVADVVLLWFSHIFVFSLSANYQPWPNSRANSQSRFGSDRDGFLVRIHRSISPVSPAVAHFYSLALFI
jgi:hypothetical protein